MSFSMIFANKKSRAGNSFADRISDFSKSSRKGFARLRRPMSRLARRFLRALAKFDHVWCFDWHLMRRSRVKCHLAPAEKPFRVQSMWLAMRSTIKLEFLLAFQQLLRRLQTALQLGVTYFRHRNSIQNFKNKRRLYACNCRATSSRVARILRMAHVTLRQSKLEWAGSFWRAPSQLWGTSHVVYRMLAERRRR